MLVIDHCAQISLDTFEKWKTIYSSKVLHNKDVSTIVFDKKTVDLFFTVEGVDTLLFESNVNHHHLVEKVDSGGELVLDEIERRAVLLLDKHIIPEQKKTLRGVDDVTTRLEARFSSGLDVGESDDEAVNDKMLSEHATTGIFYSDTACNIATTLIAKVSINKTFTLCVVGIHCTISICRLIKAVFELLKNSSVMFVVNIIDVSKKKLKYLEKTMRQYHYLFEDKNNFKLICIASNFLTIKNETMQHNNAIITFLHQSVDSCFALKFTLLQYLCSPSNCNGLQVLLFTKRVCEMANAGFSSSDCRRYVTAEKTIAVITYRPAGTEEFTVQLRDLFSFMYVANIHPDKQSDSIKYWEIWKSLKCQSEIKCREWLFSADALSKLLTDEFVFKNTSDIEDPIFSISDGKSKRIDIVVKLKQYLTQINNNKDLCALQDQSVSVSKQSARFKKLDERTISIFSQMFNTVFTFYSTFLCCCGILSSDFVKLRESGALSTKLRFKELSRRTQSDTYMPYEKLEYSMVLTKNYETEILKTWIAGMESEVFSTLMEEGGRYFDVTFPFPTCVS